MHLLDICKSFEGQDAVLGAEICAGQAEVMDFTLQCDDPHVCANALMEKRDEAAACRVTAIRRLQEAVVAHAAHSMKVLRQGVEQSASRRL